MEMGYARAEVCTRFHISLLYLNLEATRPSGTAYDLRSGRHIQTTLEAILHEDDIHLTHDFDSLHDVHVRAYLRILVLVSAFHIRRFGIETRFELTHLAILFGRSCDNICC